MKKTGKKALSLICSAVMAGSAVLPLAVSADWEHIGYMGDLNNDQQVNLADLVILDKHLHGTEPLTNENGYHVKQSFIGINGADGFQAGEYFATADIDQSGEIDVFDLIRLRKSILKNDWLWVWQWYYDDEVPDVPLEDNGEFIGASINDVYKFMPSQGSGRMLIIYADFADCKFSYLPSTDEIENIAFGGENINSDLYPWESITGFYKRSSKGVMDLSGKAYHYSTSNSVNDYYSVAGQKALLTEALKAMDSEIDYNDFDANSDGYIDTALLIVPGQSSNDTWWPAAVQFGDPDYEYDGVKIGHMITGNCQIDSPTDYRNFTQTILHETGHAMGLPDYYLYGRDTDFDGMHGTAGSELMDDSGGDFSCVSKLQLGWYKKDQVQVYDPSAGAQTFTLNNAQGANGNTVIIPCGELDSRYHSEYMMIEYTTKDGNNSAPPWYVEMGEGIRVYHVDATLFNNGWWTSYRYASGSEFTNDYAGRRFIRIIDDTDSDNIYKTGDIINGNISGFHWYDENGGQTVETGLSIEVGEKGNDSYTITIRPN